MNELIFLRAETGHLRTAGSTLIVPVVALKESVIRAVNADCAELVPYSTLIAAPQAWDDRPVCFGHPVANGRQLSASNNPQVLATHAFGAIQRARVENRKLLMDLHIDAKKAERIGAGRLLERLRNGEQIEVSVGCFVQTAPESGIHNGKPYRAVWRSLTPDHIAILEHTRGACSCSDGCGTYQRAAEHVEEMYAAGIAQLRAAEATPASRFADAYKAVRLRELDIEYAEQDAFRAAQPAPRVLSTAELKNFEPPDPYAAGIKALQLKEIR